MVMTALIGMGVGAALSAGISAAQGGSIGDILKSAGIGGVTGAATAGVGSAVGGSVAGMIGSGLSKAGTAMAANGGSLLSKVGTGLVTTGGKLSAFGATHGVKAALSSVKSTISGTPTGAGASITSGNTTLAPVPNESAIGTSAGPGYSGTLPDLNAAAKGLQLKGKAPVPEGTTSITSGAPQLRPYAKIDTTPNTTVSAGASGTASTKPSLLSKIGPGVKKAVGQVGVQGALSLLSMGQAAKQAKAANAVQEQSLLFQRQTYNESKAKEESRKVQLKTDAWNTYESASLFGATLYGSDSNNTLLTNGNGNQGNYSILTVGLNTSRKNDLT